MLLKTVEFSVLNALYLTPELIGRWYEDMKCITADQVAKTFSITEFEVKRGIARSIKEKMIEQHKEGTTTYYCAATQSKEQTKAKIVIGEVYERWSKLQKHTFVINHPSLDSLKYDPNPIPPAPHTVEGFILLSTMFLGQKTVTKKQIKNKRTTSINTVAITRDELKEVYNVYPAIRTNWLSELVSSGWVKEVTKGIYVPVGINTNRAALVKLQRAVIKPSFLKPVRKETDLYQLGCNDPFRYRNPFN